MPVADLSLLEEAARKAGEVALNYWGGTFQHWDKPEDAGPVTEADLAVNDLLHDILAPVVDAATIDLFLTPLLGCGHSGMRLGYGGGFYDRLFAQVGGLRLGVGFALQRVSDWESEAHDQRLDGFLSEEGLTVFE